MQNQGPLKRHAIAAIALCLLWAGVPAGAADPAVEVVDAEPLSDRELEALTGPVALYPDDLLAIVLPATTYPLQIVEADRYLEALEDDPTLEPDPDWNESVVALLNYPDVVAKLADDLDWMWELGRAVMNQEQDLLAAVERFRRDAHAAGNLASDEHQQVAVHGDTVEILPADPAVIYVPRYQPELVRVRHTRSVFHYYPRPCPVYYYPYPVGHYLISDHFWGVTSAFSIGWRSRHLHYHLLEHRSHPYFGYAYARKHYRYWTPRLYARHRYRDHSWNGHAGGRHHPGNRWKPDHYQRGARPVDQRRVRQHETPSVRASQRAQPRGGLEQHRREQAVRSRLYGTRSGARAPDRGRDAVVPRTGARMHTIDPGRQHRVAERTMRHGQPRQQAAQRSNQPHLERARPPHAERAKSPRGQRAAIQQQAREARQARAADVRVQRGARRGAERAALRRGHDPR